MTDEEYYQSLELTQLTTLLKDYEEVKVLKLLETFTCSINEDLQNFLHNKNKAIRLEKSHVTRTYLYTAITENNNPVIVGYFTISLKVLETNGLSKSIIKKLDGIDKARKHIPCYLIAQLGKSTNCSSKIGQFMLDESIETIKETNSIIGGRFIILDSVNQEKVISFYEKEPNSFILLDEKDKSKENLKMYYPLI
ncbi:hypothetical protein [Poseidonibacter antarcticus]|uniref:hypothetical protein n=1 Tax=Poseidonibacter antarcticus TaxID=2478538 RepID=UPI000EF49FAA|nr:hypothetical protein [Poseidonibacter antarcticus]